jgi:hypothetical protein
MHSTLKQKQTDDPHDILVVAPDVVLVAPEDKELSKLAHDALRHSSDPQIQTGSDLPAGPTVPPVDTTFRPAAVNDVQVPGGRRAVRALSGFLLAACIGVAAFAWQSYGDAARQIIARWAPRLVMTSSTPLENSVPAEQPSPPAVQASAAKAAATPQPAPPAQTTPQGVAPSAALSPESAQLLQSMARDLATAGQEIEQLKASIEQLKASQEQTSRDVAKVSEARASEQNLRPRISAAPPRSAAAASARKPMPPFRPSQVAAAPPLPPAAAPSAPRQPEPQPQATAQPQVGPELSSVPRPPMPVR